MCNAITESFVDCYLHAPALSNTIFHVSVSKYTVRNHAVSGHNRHFCLKMAWLREQVQLGVVNFKFVASKNNVADMFTKILPDAMFLKLRQLLTLFPSHGCSNEGGVSK